MNDLSEYRIVVNRSPLRLFGCAGCLIVLFIIGGIVGLLWMGWKALLGI